MRSKSGGPGQPLSSTLPMHGTVSQHTASWHERELPNRSNRVTWHRIKYKILSLMSHKVETSSCIRLTARWNTAYSTYTLTAAQDDTLCFTINYIGLKRWEYKFYIVWHLRMLNQTFCWDCMGDKGGESWLKCRKENHGGKSLTQPELVSEQHCYL